MYFNSYKINWLRILDIESTTYDSLSIEEKQKRRLRAKSNFLYCRPSISNEIKKSSFLFFKSLVREDYDRQIEDLVGLCEDSIYIDIKYTTNKKVRKYPFYILIKYFPLLVKTNFQLNFKKMSFLIANQIKYLEVAEKIFKNRFQFLVVYADMQPLDNMLCQYAKSKNIKTVTIQHGLYVNYEEQPNINCVNYRNQIAEYFLSWGDETRKLIKEFHPDTNIVICGKPLKTINPRKNLTYFSIVFDQRIFQMYNMKLLEIATKYAKKYNLHINLKLHPSNKISEYTIDNDIVKFDKDIDNSLFVLGHTTSLLYELMRQGIPTYKLKSSIASNDIDDTLTFSSYSELLKIVKEKENFDFINYAKYYIKYIDTKSLEVYKDFFKRLKNEQI